MSKQHEDELADAQRRIAENAQRRKDTLAQGYPYRDPDKAEQGKGLPDSIRKVIAETPTVLPADSKGMPPDPRRIVSADEWLKMNTKDNSILGKVNDFVGRALHGKAEIVEEDKDGDKQTGKSLLDRNAQSKELQDEGSSGRKRK